MVCKAVERKAVSMLQMLFSAVSITNSDNAIDYLKNFHSNLHLDNDLTVDQFIDAVDRFVVQQEGPCVFLHLPWFVSACVVGHWELSTNLICPPGTESRLWLLQGALDYWSLGGQDPG